MSRTLDALCAMALGWELRHVDGQDYYYMPDRDALMPITEFEPSTDPAAARQLEDEIERRGLRRPYVSALWDIAGCNGNDEGENIWLDEWKLIRATPEQRARAFLEVTREW